MFGSALTLALAVGVLPNPYLLRLHRVRAAVMHVGKPVEVKLLVRTRRSAAEPWRYISDLDYLPRRLKTSPQGRTVLVRLPEQLDKESQLCVRYTPSPSEQRVSLQLSVESCAGLPARIYGQSQTATT